MGIKGISGGGKKAPRGLSVPDFSDPKMQKARDPEFYKAAAKTRKSAFSSVGQEYVIDDGLTDLERKQRSIAPSFLTGSAKSQADATTIRDDVEADDFFGLGPDPSNFFLLLFLVFLDWLDAFQETSHYKLKNTSC